VDDAAFDAMAAILQQTVDALKSDGIVYRGVLYGGFILTPEGPKVLEFNARFGDPETQVILPRLESDLVDVLGACVAGTLAPETIRWNQECSVGVVMASGGYPGQYEKGKVITGLDRVGSGVAVFHAGTRLDDSGRTVTDGGRVLNVVATGETMAEARERAYDGVAMISFADMMYRTDIALREVS